MDTSFTSVNQLQTPSPCVAYQETLMNPNMVNSILAYPLSYVGVR